ncbi:hypothetical protein [Xanthobacter pseudotagetidis]|uniref:hypothetical protein n=1 Tax=Xanthobacter pseudotagetidis TaxID=3119911 RepID=UPI003729661D
MAETLEAGVAAPADASRQSARGPSSAFSSPLAVWGIALFGGALFAAAVLLWMRNGVSVFFDTLTAGIGSCL